jgi:hypothetical protein
MSKRRRRPVESVQERTRRDDMEWFRRTGERVRIRSYRPGELGALKLSGPVHRVVVEYLAEGIFNRSYEFDQRSIEPLGTEEEILEKFGKNRFPKGIHRTAMRPGRVRVATQAAIRRKDGNDGDI